MQKLLKECNICPRECGADRFTGSGYCGSGCNIKVAKAFLHRWEEPCISGDKGSGAIFFSGCNLNCIFCQNYEISQEHFGKEITVERLADIMLELQEQGAANINFVTPTPYTLQIMEAIRISKANGLVIPIVYNTNGYEKVETVELLKNTVDIYLPDIKYFSDEAASRYSNAPEYFRHTAAAVKAMVTQVGYPVFDEEGMMKSGVLIRHLVLPGCLEESKRILDWIMQELGPEIYVSLMCQYTPMYKASGHPEINRRLTEAEYDEIIDYFFEIGLENGFAQEPDSATSDYTPIFDLTGI